MDWEERPEKGDWMKSSVCRLGLVICTWLASALFASCGPAPAPSPTAAPPATETPAPPTATATRLPTATPTSTPEPTPIPGVEVIPITEFDRGVPWLARDLKAVPQVIYYGFNLRHPPFGEPLVRKAFAAAMDREALADLASSILHVTARPATTITPPQVLGRDLYGAVGVPFDPARAREYLAQAGYSDPGALPEITLVLNRAGEKAPGAYVRLADATVAMWKEHLGVTVKVKVMSTWGAYTQLLREGSFDIARLGWAADYVDPSNFLRDPFRTGNNNTGFSNSAFDDLVDRAANRDDPSERQRFYIRAEQILTQEEVAVIPLYYLGP
jgi:oligopeptide transport system substrate-binding protein